MPDTNYEFINPYTFVPFPEQIEKRAPAGHHELGRDEDGAARYCGRLTITATARTRIIAGAWGEDVLLPWRPGLDGEREAMIPGSSLAGAVRSLHETLAGGCLRVFDADVIPTYREPAREDSFRGLSLALVTDADEDGTPTAVRVSTQVVWIDGTKLRDFLAAHNEELRTALVLTTEQRGQKVVAGRTIVDLDMAEPREDGDWVVLVGDSGTRQTSPRFRVALGKFTRAPEKAVFGPGVWDTYRRHALDTNDMRTYRKDEASLAAQLATERASAHGGVPTASVTWNGDPEFGVRQRVRPWALPGTVVWVRKSAGRISEVKRAVVWRRSGAHPAGQRLPLAELRACDDPRQLCPSCRIFGSADIEGRDEDAAARQRSYAGHVRFGDLIAEGLAPDSGEVLELAPLSSPRPGAGQFYLDNTGVKPPARDQRPQREWGSIPDAREPRRLRGRKFYWHTTDQHTHGPERWQRRPTHTNDDMITRTRVFPATQRFTGTIHFDGLTETELGGLICAISPAHAITTLTNHKDPQQICLPIGGGKPFGFGALHTDVTLAWIDSAASRYGQGPAPEVTVESATGRFRDSVPETSRKRVWRALAAVLTLDRVDATRVWYPPGAGWAQHDAESPQAIEKFDTGFEFWKQTQGIRLSEEERLMEPLPPVTARPDQQFLPILTDRDRKRP